MWSCIECGVASPRWHGQCPHCSAWNTLVEEKRTQGTSTASRLIKKVRREPVSLGSVEFLEQDKIHSTLPEFDRLIGGGIVPGAVTLLGGEPGIGKSTLLLQLAEGLARSGKTVLYISGEESLEQVTLRARRLGAQSEKLLFLAEVELETILEQAEKLNPDALIVDSIQIVYKSAIPSSPGSIVQVRECASSLTAFAKEMQIATFLIGHVTKSGEIAGPRVLEHLVDTVLYFESGKHPYRLVRAFKNRFGPTDEIAVFEMQAGGLIEIPNPSELFLKERSLGLAGSVIVSSVEGSRPLLVEVQSLVAETGFSTPTRRASGLDSNRLALLLAVLEKRLQYPLFRCDVFVSVAGGIKIVEPGIDLGILLAIASSFCNHPIDAETIVIGEVGLGGEIRAVSRIEARVKEAVHLGFKRCLVPKTALAALKSSKLEGISICGIGTVNEAVNEAFLKSR